MTFIEYATERRLLSIDRDGIATVWQGAQTIETSELDDNGRRVVFGGFGGGTFKIVNLRDLLTRDEHRQLTEYLKRRKQYDNAKTEEERKNIIEKMQFLFKTTDMVALETWLLEKIKADPRLIIRTRKGQLIKTTVKQRKRYLAARDAGTNGAFDKI